MQHPRRVDLDERQAGATEQSIEPLSAAVNPRRARSTRPATLGREALGEPTLADAILDRLVHNAHRLELRGDSMRRPRDERPGGPGTAATAEAANEPARRVADYPLSS